MRKNKKYLLCLFILIIIVYILKNINKKPKLKVKESFIFSKHLESTESDEFVLHSDCYCQRELIRIKKKENFYKITVYNYGESFFLYYNLTKKNFESLVLTCNLYNVLRKGPNQNIISYSLFSVDSEKDAFLSRLSDRLQFVKLNFKDWRIRVYHDHSIDKSVICEKQCLKDTNDEFYDNIDFCNIAQMPVNIFSTWNADRVLPELWKWFPMADDFVSRVAPRNNEACLLNREADAMNEWIKSQRMFHIMRDHPMHDKPIIEGLWALKTGSDREISRNLFSLVNDEDLIEIYRYKHDFIDEILKDFVWPLTKEKSVFSHDSYYCQKYDSMSFPTKRVLNCYVGSTHCCSPNSIPNIERAHICPEACRPLSYEGDWIFC